MRRRVAWLLSLAVLPLVGPVQAVEAAGVGACTISGTIEFVPSAQTPAQGLWSVAPAVIECQGMFNGVGRITGPGSFSGTGSYTALTSGSGACVHQVGSGTVDYTLETIDTTVRISEPHEFVLAGAGAFSTPSLNGSFQLMPYEGDCVTAPVTKALFLAQGTFLRGAGPRG